MKDVEFKMFCSFFSYLVILLNVLGIAEMELSSSIEAVEVFYSSECPGIKREYIFLDFRCVHLYTDQGIYAVGVDFQVPKVGDVELVVGDFTGVVYGYQSANTGFNIFGWVFYFLSGIGIILTAVARCDVSLLGFGALFSFAAFSSFVRMIGLDF